MVFVPDFQKFLRLACQLFQKRNFNLFETRFKLHKALYQHPTARGIELQILDAFQENIDAFKKFLTPGNFPNCIEEFCYLDDSIIEKIQYKEYPIALNDLPEVE